MIKKNKIRDPEHLTGTDRYLVTYADLITLLLALFVLLYSASRLDEEKYKELSNAFGKYFSTSEKGALNGGNGVLKSNRPAIPAPALPAKGQKDISQVMSDARQALGRYMQSGALSIRQNGQSIIITLPEKLLFNPGKADVNKSGRDVIDSLSALVRGIDKQVAIDGHTDSEPVRANRLGSNWQLSVNRALGVGYLLLQSGLPENCLVIRGFGAQRPVADNSTANGRAANRRVEITISELPSDAPSTEGYARQK